MVVGENNDLALDNENDEGGDGGASSGLADSGNPNFPNTISTSNPNVVTTGESKNSLAKEKKIGVKLHIDTVKAEQRVKFLRTLSMLGVGTNRIETNQIKSRRSGGGIPGGRRWRTILSMTRTRYRR